MLIVCFFRAKREHFSRTQHVGFEISAWYWHSVDVVWIFLWIWVYVWGS
jgi:cytochrome c oxidase subunit 3